MPGFQLLGSKVGKSLETQGHPGYKASPRTARDGIVEALLEIKPNGKALDSYLLIFSLISVNRGFLTLGIL